MSDQEQTGQVDPIEFLKRALAISREDAEQVRKDAPATRPREGQRPTTEHGDENDPGA